jgi:inosine-uridine nucleoside N-ribohydrolase
MKKLIPFLIVCISVCYGCRNEAKDQTATPVKIIFDSDLGPDYDDAGALAFLHAMADSGKAEILATIASNKHKLVAPSIEVINTYFGRPELPIGGPKTVGADMGSSQHWADSIVSKYPHKLNSTDEAENAVTLYRRILNSQPDQSVTIVTVGFLTNLANLLDSKSDDISNLAGGELISKKVKLLVSMAGTFPSGREFNVFIDSVSSKKVFDNWPGQVIFTGFEIGSKIKTGLRLASSDIKNSPVKDVFRISIPLSEEDRNGRMSWDETAVLIGIYGTEGFFDTVRGRIVVNTNGSNSWEDNPAGRQVYVKQKMPITEMAEFIEDRMMHQPVKK